MVSVEGEAQENPMAGGTQCFPHLLVLEEVAHSPPAVSPHACQGGRPQAECCGLGHGPHFTTLWLTTVLTPPLCV